MSGSSRMAKRTRCRAMVRLANAMRPDRAPRRRFAHLWGYKSDRSRSAIRRWRVLSFRGSYIKA